MIPPYLGGVTSPVIPYMNGVILGDIGLVNLEMLLKIVRNPKFLNSMRFWISHSIISKMWVDGSDTKIKQISVNKNDMARLGMYWFQ